MTENLYRLSFSTQEHLRGIWLASVGNEMPDWGGPCPPPARLLHALMFHVFSFFKKRFTYLCNRSGCWEFPKQMENQLLKGTNPNAATEWGKWICWLSSQSRIFWHLHEEFAEKTNCWTDPEIFQWRLIRGADTFPKKHIFHLSLSFSLTHSLTYTPHSMCAHTPQQLDRGIKAV